MATDNENTRIRGILFDKDGTLIDFHGTWLPAYRAVTVSVAGGDPVLADRLFRIGGGDPGSSRIIPESVFAAGPISGIAEAWQPLLAEWQADDLLAAVIDGLAKETLRHCRALTGAAALLRRLASRGLQLGVATNDGERGARAMLEKLRLSADLAFVAGWDSGFTAKPSPDMVHGFCRTTDLEPAAVMVVGDSIADLEMARRAGVGLRVGVLSGTGTRKELAAHANIIINDITALEELLDDR